MIAFKAVAGRRQQTEEKKKVPPLPPRLCTLFTINSRHVHVVWKSASRADNLPFTHQGLCGGRGYFCLPWGRLPSTLPFWRLQGKGGPAEPLGPRNGVSGSVIAIPQDSGMGVPLRRLHRASPSLAPHTHSHTTRRERSRCERGEIRAARSMPCLVRVAGLEG